MSKKVQEVNNDDLKINENQLAEIEKELKNIYNNIVNQKLMRAGNFAAITAIMIPVLIMISAWVWQLRLANQNREYNRPIWEQTDFKQVLYTTDGTDRNMRLFLAKDFPTNQFEQMRKLIDEIGDYHIMRIDNFFDRQTFNEMGGRRYTWREGIPFIPTTVGGFITIFVVFGTLGSMIEGKGSDRHDDIKRNNYKIRGDRRRRSELIEKQKQIRYKMTSR